MPARRGERRPGGHDCRQGGIGRPHEIRHEKAPVADIADGRHPPRGGGRRPLPHPFGQLVVRLLGQAGDTVVRRGIEAQVRMAVDEPGDKVGAHEVEFCGFRWAGGAVTAGGHNRRSVDKDVGGLADGAGEDVKVARRHQEDHGRSAQPRHGVGQ